ncbi:hypothetical protein SAMD00019534_016270 [Acytostelium subglobosum LB1]|uniref:hypothetical protein n=1 Tax=Acytostelium subglobosum LB1 TaxID=1410327 RepID=UPI0006450ADB|nr:hypothetical protein SAMD00019534_016270 [Acytostelium subglobosum LB1]GAM18452.1 hypothetical protein SAMD00019534_016270 [Acytostelium subglobosum LB1]|eukprot:XP_012757672.1 hypothetical protein SAMD00019534_016270 [Acytostelium subglobosum LB1]
MGKSKSKSSQAPQKSKYFVAVMGSGSVGKSALTVQFTQGIFIDKYDPTVEDTYTKTFELDGENVCIEVLDTAGSEVLVAMRELYMKSAEGFVLVYSILVKSTFNELKDIIEQLFRVKEEEEVPIVLVGNKIDLDSHREVSTNEGKALSQSYPNCDFWETSCKDRINVDNTRLPLEEVIETVPLVDGESPPRMTYFTDNGSIQTFKQRMKQRAIDIKQMQIDTLNEEEYNLSISDSLYNKRVNMYEPTPASISSPVKSKSEQKDIQITQLLFGQSEVIDTSPRKELSVGSIIEFLMDNKMYLGVIQSVSSNNATVRYLDHYERNAPIMVEDHVISKRSILGSWPIDQYTIKDPKYLLQLEESYRNGHIYAQLRSFPTITNLFRSTTRKFSTLEATKVTTCHINPGFRDMFTTFRAINTDPNFSYDIVRGGYRVVELQLEPFDAFLDRLKSFIQLVKAPGTVTGTGTGITESTKEITFFNHFIPTSDYQYINLIKLYLIYPVEHSSPFPSMMRMIFDAVGMKVSRENAHTLLSTLGFQMGIPSKKQRAVNLFTEESRAQAQKIIACIDGVSGANVTDPLATLRQDFDLPVMAIDPVGVLGAEDAFSIDPNESDDKQTVLYIHTLDIPRWFGKESVLFKNAMLNHNTMYNDTLGVMPMLPHELTNKMAIGVTNKSAAYAITQRLVIDNKTSDIISQTIIPTRLKNIIQISHGQGEVILKNMETMSPDDMSTGHQIMKKMQDLARVREINRDLRPYGRFVRKGNNATFVTADIINAVLTYGDEGITQYFNSRRSTVFYKNDFSAFYTLSPMTKERSFVRMSAPLRHFKSMFAQVQLHAYLLSDGIQPAFSTADANKICHASLNIMFSILHFEKLLVNSRALLRFNEYLNKERLLAAERSSGSGLGKSGMTKKQYQDDLKQQQYAPIEMSGVISSYQEQSANVNIHFAECDYTATDIPCRKWQRTNKVIKLGDKIQVSVSGIDWGTLKPTLEVISIL